MTPPRPRRALDAAPDDLDDPVTTPAARPRRALDIPTDPPAQTEATAFRRPSPTAGVTRNASTAWAVRPAWVARIAVPMAVALAGLSGVAYAAWPQPAALTAVPAAASSAPATESNASASSSSSTDAAAVAKAAAVAQAEQREAEEKASEAAERAAAKAAKKAADGWQQAAQTMRKVVPELDVTGDMYATTELNLRTEASKSADVVTTVKSGAKLQVTDTVSSGFRLVEADGKARWVSNKYLSDDKPKQIDTISGSVCSKGSAMERGLTPDAIAVHRAICAKFPQVSAFGGVRAGDGGFHGSGRAVDAMISDSSVGWEIARWVRANAKSLGVSEVIYSQKIWTVQRSGEGWRGMSDRGSASANHYDHVHVSVYGNSGTV